jgi:zinc transporter ZupT
MGRGRLFAGCGVFFAGDSLIDRLGGSDRKDATGDQQSGSPLAIVLGTVLDGIPESMVIGLTIYEGGAVGAAYLAAVFISNLPESISSSAGLASGGWALTFARGPGGVVLPSPAPKELQLDAAWPGFNLTLKRLG